MPLHIRSGVLANEVTDSAAQQAAISISHSDPTPGPQAAVFTGRCSSRRKFVERGFSVLTKFGMDCYLYNYYEAMSYFYGNEDQATSFFFGSMVY